MAKPILGNKRVCSKCSVKFYDLARKKGACPSCGTEMVFAPLKPIKAGRPKPASQSYESDDEEKLSEVSINDENENSSDLTPEAEGLADPVLPEIANELEGDLIKLEEPVVPLDDEENQT